MPWQKGWLLHPEHNPEGWVNSVAATSHDDTKCHIRNVGSSGLATIDLFGRQIAMLVDIHVHFQGDPGFSCNGKPGFANPEQLIERYDKAPRKNTIRILNI